MSIAYCLVAFSSIKPAMQAGYCSAILESNRGPRGAPEALHLFKENVRLPGFEPGLRAWEAHVITAGPQPRQGLDSRLFLCHFLLPIFKCISFSLSYSGIQGKVDMLHGPNMGIE